MSAYKILVSKTPDNVNNRFNEKSNYLDENNKFVSITKANIFSEFDAHQKIVELKAEFNEGFEFKLTKVVAQN